MLLRPRSNHFRSWRDTVCLKTADIENNYLTGRYGGIAFLSDFSEQNIMKNI